MEENKQNYCRGSKQYNRSNSFKKIFHWYFYCRMPQIKNELESLVQNINLKCITVNVNIKSFSAWIKSTKQGKNEHNYFFTRKIDWFFIIKNLEINGKIH